MNSLANVEDPTDNNIGRMGFAIAKISPDTTSKIVKVDDLDVTNESGLSGYWKIRRASRSSR